MMRSLLLILLFFTGAFTMSAQDITDDSQKGEEGVDDPSFVPMIKVGKVLNAGDSIPYIEFNDVWIYPEQTFKNKSEQKKWNRLIRNVKIVLPYAKEANNIIINTYEHLQTIPDQKARQEYLKEVEKNIKKEYTPKMKKLTYAQGKLLIKLVNRECSSSGYDIIKAILGPVRAGFYQAFAWTFGASLKKEYDPEGVDKVTERVVRMVEAGQI